MQAIIYGTVRNTVRAAVSGKKAIICIGFQSMYNNDSKNKDNSDYDDD